MKSSGLSIFSVAITISDLCKRKHPHTASFEFLMTDYTPRWTFYPVQDPRIPTG